MTCASLIAVVLTYLIPAKYTARASILLDSAGDATNLINLAQMSDLLPPGALPQSRRENGYAYLAIAQSRGLLTDLLHRPQMSNPRVTYMESLGPYHGSDLRRTETAVKELRQSLGLDFDARNGVLQVAVTNDDPVVAADIANQLVAELKRFNTEVRSSRAQEAVRFVEARLQESRSELTDSENRLAAFNRANLRIGTAPELQLQEKRLDRNVRFCEDIYSLLTKQLELAQIQEKKESAVFTIMDQAVPPTRANRFSPVLAILFASFVSGTAFFLFLSWKALDRSDPDRSSEWGDAKGAA